MRFWSLNTLRSSLRQGTVFHPYIIFSDVFMAFAPTYTSIFHITVPPSAYPSAFPKAFASEAILPTTRLATYRLLKTKP
jgi:hypothetical protein